MYILYYGFKGHGQTLTHNIAVDFEEGVVYPFEETEEDYDIDYDMPHDMSDMIKESV